jgi:1,4-dihydroxy-2-naphthoyl-CoA hydrolase
MCVDQAQYLCVGQEINANHVRSARHGHVTGTARLVHQGGRTQVWSIDIVGDATELVCVSRMTLAVVNRRSGSTV